MMKKKEKEEEANITNTNDITDEDCSSVECYNVAVSNHGICSIVDRAVYE